MTIHRPDFASVTLANDLRKLEEDWVRLEHVAMRKAAVDYPTDLNRSHIFASHRIACTVARTHLIEGVITWHVARLKRDMLEAAFHVARRDIDGLDPIPYSPCPDESPAQPIEVPC